MTELEIYLYDYVNNLVVFRAFSITVDGIYTTRDDDSHHIQPMFTFKEESFWEGHYEFIHDGSEMDEELWLKEGVLISMKASGKCGR